MCGDARLCDQVLAGLVEFDAWQWRITHPPTTPTALTHPPTNSSVVALSFLPLALQKQIQLTGLLYILSTNRHDCSSSMCISKWNLNLSQRLFKQQSTFHSNSHGDKMSTTLAQNQSASVPTTRSEISQDVGLGIPGAWITFETFWSTSTKTVINKSIQNKHRNLYYQTDGQIEPNMTAEINKQPIQISILPKG